MRYIWVNLLLCLLSSSLMAAGEDIAKIIKDADSALWSWDSYRAIELYEQALKMDPSDTQKCGIYRDMGAAWLRTMEQKKAWPPLKKALSCNPDDSMTNYWVSAYYGLFPSGKKHAKHLQRAIDLDPANYLAQYRMAQEEVSENNFANAAARLEKAAPHSAGKREEPDILRGWSYALIRMQLFDKALEINADIIKRFPAQEGATYASNGYIFYRQGKLQQAFGMYQKSVQAEGASETDYYTFINIASDLGEYDAALKAADRLGNIARDRSRFLAAKGLILYLKGDLDQAEKAYQESLSFLINPTDTSRHICLVRIYREKREQKKLQEILATARKIIESLISNYPKDPNHYWTMAWLLAEAGQDLDEAMALYAAGERINPNNPDSESKHLEGLIYFEKGDYKAAIPRFSKTVPGENLDHFHLGQAYSLVGDRKAAKEIWDKRLKVNPKDRFILKAMQEASAKRSGK